MTGGSATRRAPGYGVKRFTRGADGQRTPHPVQRDACAVASVLCPVPGARRSIRQRGVALAMLLWMLAALSLLVSGVVYQSRTDVQLTRLQLDQARAQAAAMGAAHLLLAEMTLAASSGEAGEGEGGIFTRQYELNGLALDARAIPVSGLVDLNLAPPELLTALFQYQGQLDADTAAQLAEQLVSWRVLSQGSPDDHGDNPDTVGNGALVIIEDLLRVPGMSRAVYDRVRTAVHTEPGGQPGIDALAAPEEVLLSIANGDSGVVDTMIDARQEGAGSAAGLSGLDPAYLAAGVSSSYRVDIRVSQPGERALVQRVWARMAAGQAGVPWQFTRVVPVEADPQPAGEGRHAG